MHYGRRDVCRKELLDLLLHPQRPGSGRRRRPPPRLQQTRSVALRLLTPAQLGPPEEQDRQP